MNGEPCLLHTTVEPLYRAATLGEQNFGLYIEGLFVDLDLHSVHLGPGFLAGSTVLHIYCVTSVLQNCVSSRGLALQCSSYMLLVHLFALRVHNNTPA